MGSGWDDDDNSQCCTKSDDEEMVLAIIANDMNVERRESQRRGSNNHIICNGVQNTQGGSSFVCRRIKKAVLFIPYVILWVCLLFDTTSEAFSTRSMRFSRYSSRTETLFKSTVILPAIQTETETTRSSSNSATSPVLIPDLSPSQLQPKERIPQTYPSSDKQDTDDDAVVELEIDRNQTQRPEAEVTVRAGPGAIITHTSGSVVIDDTNNGRRRRPRAEVTVRAGPGVVITHTSGSVVMGASSDPEEDSILPNEARNEEDSSRQNDEHDEEDENGLNVEQKRRVAAATAALLRRARGTTGKKGDTTGGRRATTSVGKARIGAASRARATKGGLAGALLGTMRTAASAAASVSSRNKNEATTTTTNDDATNHGNATKSSDQSSPTSNNSGPTRKSAVQNTITNLIQSQDEARRAKQSKEDGRNNPSMGMLAGPQTKRESQRVYSSTQSFVHRSTYQPPAKFMLTPYPGTTLIHPSSSSSSSSNKNGDALSVRVATAQDDYTIANLRLSVFSDFSPKVRKQFCQRSCEALAQRRLRGATCIVASLPKSMRGEIISRYVYEDGHPSYSYTPPNSDLENEEWIMGTVECSVHEFAGTMLGRSRLPEQIMYITEVAVSPRARRFGVGTRLLQGIHELAALRQVETLYLHVDVTNRAAIRLYEKAGYTRIRRGNPLYEEFTISLNLHDGATKGRKHYLLHKHVTPEPTWLYPEHPPKPKKSRLGFELPF
eukprot:scaffold17814_cov53-Attheya_sp.AAC.2